MNEIDTKEGNYDLAIKRLKEFSETENAELEIDEVKEDGFFFGLGNHKVTGSELNVRLETIQKNFIAVNTKNDKMVKEFREVYNAFKALERDHLRRILTNVKSIEKTSDDVRKHHERLAKQQSKLNAHQVTIEKEAENNSKAVEMLKAFKKKIESYKHLNDIDRIWEDSIDIQDKIQMVSDNVTNLSQKATEDIASVNKKNKALSDRVNRDILTLRNETKSFKELFSELSEQIESIVDLLDNQLPVIKETAFFTEQLKKVVHLDDVDSMWDDINQTKLNFKSIENNIEKIENDILQMDYHLNEINSFVDSLNEYTHLKDIDNMWEDLIVSKKNIEEINRNIQINKSEIKTLSSMNMEHHEALDILFKDITSAEEYAVESRNLIIKLDVFREKVSAINHLMEVDTMWKLTKEHKMRIDELVQKEKSQKKRLDDLEQVDDIMQKSIMSNDRNINVLMEYKNHLRSFSHLDDIDNTWKKVEGHSSKIAECQKKDKDLAKTVQKNNKEVNKKITEAMQTSNDAIKSFNKKIKYAYLIAGGSMVLAIIEMILLIMRVI